MKTGYDIASEDCARHFLEHDPAEEDVRSLAQRIQDAVEDWLADHKQEVKG